MNPGTGRLAAVAVLALAAVAAGATNASATGRGSSYSYRVSYSKQAGGNLDFSGWVSGPKGRSVHLERYTSGAWHTLGSSSTDSHGQFKVHTVTHAAGAYKLRLAFSAKGGYATATSKTVTEAISLFPDSVYVRADSTSAVLNTTDGLVADATGRGSSRTAELQKLSGSTWHTVATRTIKGVGRGTCMSGVIDTYSHDYCSSFKLPTSSAGTVSYRVALPATAVDRAVVSKTVKITTVSARPSVSDVSTSCEVNEDGTRDVYVGFTETTYSTAAGVAQDDAPAPWGLSMDIGLSGPPRSADLKTYLAHEVAPGTTLPAISVLWHNPQTGSVETIPVTAAQKAPTTCE